MQCIIVLSATMYIIQVSNKDMVDKTVTIVTITKENIPYIVIISWIKGGETF